MGFIQGDEREQLMLPISLDDMVEKENPVRIIDAFVESIDLEKLHFTSARPARTGRPAYAAADLLKLYIYGYQNTIRSSRKLEREAGRNMELMWLLKKLKPDHKTIAEFRKNNAKPLAQVFHQFVKVLDSMNLLGKEIIAIDGTKIKASNNKKQNFSRKKLNDRIKRINEQIETYLKDIDNNDRKEDRIPELDVPAIVKTLKERKGQYEGYLQELDENGTNEKSLIDPDARLMGNNRGGVEMSYNVQSAVDEKHHLIVDFNVSKNPSDHGQLSIMAKRVKKRFKLKKITAIADKGYYNGEDLSICKKNKIETIVSRQETRKAPDEKYNADKFIYNEEKDYFICPQNQILHLRKKDKSIGKRYYNKEACKDCPDKNNCTKGNYRNITKSKYQKIYQETDQRTREKINLYKKRQMIVEHPFGTIKHTLNGNYFLLRTEKKVRGEVALLFLAYNLKRAINLLGFERLMEKLKAISLCLFGFIGYRYEILASGRLVLLI